jgi:hypothetical protein
VRTSPVPRDWFARSSLPPIAHGVASIQVDV